jgi:6,7-dimethyl-8-ribityllumazine synthase
MKKTAAHAVPKKINREWKIDIVASSFYKKEIDALIAGAKKTLHDAGINDKNITVHMVPGSFEIPLIGAELAEMASTDALIGLGIIVEGDTHHARLLADATTRGIMDTQMKYHLPFAFEVLYVKTLADARARTLGKNNKGIEAATAVLHTLAALKKIRK